MSFIDLFDAAVASYPQNICFVNSWDKGSAVNYIQAQLLTKRIAYGLQALGYKAGFHGAVLSGNSVDAFIALLGVMRAHGVWIPVNVRNAVDANISFLQDMDCDVLFYQSKYIKQVDKIRSTVTSIRHFIALDEAYGDDLSVASLANINSVNIPLETAVAPDDMAMLMSTGGTTGRSKGVILSHRNLVSTLANHMSAIHVTDSMNVLAVAPITHTSGIVSMPFVARGGRIVLMDQMSPQLLLKLIETEKINILFLPPTVIYMLLAEPNIRDFDFSSLQYLLYGAAPMSPDKLIEAIDVFGPVMIQVYGQAEVPAAISVLRIEDHFINGDVAPHKRLFSVGRPFPFTKVGIMDNNGNLLSEPGAVGEIVARGDIVTSGYYKNHEATKDSLKNGWHCTGDIGYFDEEGFLYIVDRKNDMIITGGFNVYSSEVEAAVMAHKSVKDCAVIGVPDDKWGEAVTAFIEIRSGKLFDEADLIEFVKEKIGSVKAPKEIIVVECLPRSAVGKVLKKNIRKQYLK